MRTSTTIFSVPIFIVVLLGTAAAQNQRDAEKSLAKNMELKACGPRDKEAKYVVHTDWSHHRTPEPPVGKAMIYVLLPLDQRMLVGGRNFQITVAVDGEWKGVNGANNYFSFALAAGEHYFCSKWGNRSVSTVNVEAGKTYFLQQRMLKGLKPLQNSLELLSEEEGKKALLNCLPSTWDPR